MERLTYRSSMGDYGSEKHFDDEWQEKCALRNALGKYEDLGCTPEELQKALDKVRAFSNKIGKIEFRKEDDDRMSMSVADHAVLMEILHSHAS